MTALAAKQVCRRYGGQTVLDGFDLELEKGAFEVLMGPSGCGKSTFMHLAAGLIAADSGEISVGGAVVTEMKDSVAAKFRRRHIGVVFQEFNLLNEKSVLDNIYLPLRLDGAKIDAETRSRFERIVSVLGLADKLNKKPEELSGGERQRVAIARALIANPAVVLADEPTGNLDVKAARAICEILKSLNDTEESAILLVTHDPVVAAAAKKVHFLKDGKIAASFDTYGDAARISEKYLEVYG